MAAKYLIVLLGPTAIGKTKWAIDIAAHYKTAILSADSRQFYREMKIGTAVPTPEELGAAPHYFIQHKSIHDSYSVGDWVDEATATIEELHAIHDIVVLTGGSNLYINALLYGLDDFPDIDPAIRKRLNQQLKEEGIRSLQEQLKTLDPVYYEHVDQDNPHRLIRALEICIGSGNPYSSFLGKNKVTHDFEVLLFGLEIDRELLYDRINSRVDQMIKAGLLEEAKALHKFRHLNALQTVGYRELFSYFDGEISLDEAIAAIKTNSRRYAKRQLTWLRKMEGVYWFDPQSPTQKIINIIDKHTH